MDVHTDEIHADPNFRPGQDCTIAMNSFYESRDLSDTVGASNPGRNIQRAG